MNPNIGRLGHEISGLDFVTHEEADKILKETTRESWITKVDKHFNKWGNVYAGGILTILGAGFGTAIGYNYSENPETLTRTTQTLIGMGIGTLIGGCAAIFNTYLSFQDKQ